MKIYDIRVEYQKRPDNISIKNPRFSWKIKSEKQNTMQTAYQVIVQKKEKIVWDSGIEKSEQSVHITYLGEELKPETEYQVNIKVWDNHGEMDEQETSFETGIFEGISLKAEMITHDFPQEETSCPIFYKRIKINKKVKKAFAYATAHGVYEMNMDGSKIGDIYMAPGWTSYHNRLMFQKYDITEIISKKAEHLIEIVVGNGWYKGILGFVVKPDNYGDRIAAMVEIHVYYEDGSCEIIATDETWKVRTGKIKYSEIYMGETIDTCEEEGKEGKVSIVDFDKKILKPQENEPVRIIEKIQPVSIFKDPMNHQLVDFGQIITGVVEVHIKGTTGQKITISHAETLDKEGVFYPETLRQAISVDNYILNGKEQVLHPHFTFHGFRYAKVEGVEDLKPEMFTALVIHSDMEKIGEFHCSNAKVEQLQKNITWGLRDNFLDIPTDCPQRDERLGWTGDAQIFAATAAFNRNTARFFTKWLHDVVAESSLEKGVPCVVPDIMGQFGASAWSDAAVIIPWVVYQTYADTRILEECWKCMHEWVDYVQKQTGENGLWMSGFQYGDWLALDKEESADRTGATDKYMIANAYYLYVTDLVRKTAEILGKKEAEKYYGDLYNTTLEIFRDEYYTKTGRIVSETQTGAVISLHFNLAREKDRKRILNTLITNIENHKNHLATGFVGTPYLCHALSDNGAHDVAATVFMKEDYPSWLYAVNKGATTIWERWNSIMPDGSFEASGMNSLNHYAYGSIGEWMYQKIAGLTLLEPGYKRFRIKPMFVKGIEEASVTLESMYGTIESRVICRDGKIHLKVVVPTNTTAEIHLPEKEEILEVGSGIYEYSYETKTLLSYERFSMESTFGEIVNEPLAVAMFEQMVPGMLDHPMIQYSYSMTLVEMTATAPEARPLYEAVIKALNEQERKK